MAAVCMVFYTNCGEFGDTSKALSGDPANGQLVYTSVTPACVNCHGATGGGVFGQGSSIIGKSNRVANAVRNGIATMPSYNTTDITDQELADLIAYVAQFTN